MAEYDYDEVAQDTPVWAVFGDLMAALVGIFVLLLVWTLGLQVELSRSLEDEVALREAEQQRRMELEQALADPLTSNRITLQDGRIGISGQLLFELNSAALQPEGRALIASLAAPLARYLSQSDHLLMVSGFTDDLPVHADNLVFADNWELSAQRALTVTRALVEAGLSRELVFASAFAEQQPIAPNTSADNRALNRRVEIAPVPRTPRGEDAE
ncbi:OmpA family protein [Haliea sp.]|uniref:OmpA family protein n=1 Tax=Haliea sp. TaxID=1932666 RepID=UPI003526EDEF